MPSKAVCLMSGDCDPSHSAVLVTVTQYAHSPCSLRTPAHRWPSRSGLSDCPFACHKRFLHLSHSCFILRSDMHSAALPPVTSSPCPLSFRVLVRSCCTSDHMTNPTRAAEAPFCTGGGDEGDAQRRDMAIYGYAGTRIIVGHTHWDSATFRKRKKKKPDPCASRRHVAP